MDKSPKVLKPVALSGVVEDSQSGRVNYHESGAMPTPVAAQGSRLHCNLVHVGRPACPQLNSTLGSVECLSCHMRGQSAEPSLLKQYVDLNS